MVNNIVLVGRLVQTPEIFETDNGNKMSVITLAVPRSYKNQNGEYDTDFLDCTLWTGIAENTAEYCKTGDMIGIKGRLQSRLIENEDGFKYKKVEVIAERVTFLSSSKNNSLSNKDNEINNELIQEVKEDNALYEKRKKGNSKKVKS